MKKIIYFVVLLAFPMMLAAQDVSKSMGDSAYAKGNYAEAISVYENLLENVGESSELHYNLGNVVMDSSPLGYTSTKPIKSIDYDTMENFSKYGASQILSFDLAKSNPF